MTKTITKGKVIACLISLAITGCLWNVFFPAGGSGANIILGLFIAFFFIQYFCSYFGGLIDQEFFPGGSKERARAYRSLERFIKESRAHFNSIKKSKKRQKKVGQKVFDEFEQAMIQASLVLKSVASEWDDKNSSLKHEQMLKEAHARLEKAGKVLFEMDRNWRFLLGIPSLIIALFFALVLREFVIEPYQIPSGSMIPSLLVGDHLFVSKFYYGLSKPFAKDPSFLIQWRKPKVGDVVVFKAPDYVGRHAGQAWIKRVVATEGQSLKVNNSIIYIDDKPYMHIVPEEIVTYMDFYGFGTANGGVWREQRARKTTEQIGEVKHPIYLPIFPLSPNVGPYWPTVDQEELPGLTCDATSCKVKEGFIFVMGDNRGNSADSRTWGALPVSRVKGKALFIWMSVDGSGQSVQIGPFSMPKFRFDRWFTGII